MLRQYQAQYLGNTNSKEVHDLHHEKPQCQISEIINAGHARPFATLQAVLSDDRCYWCLGNSNR